MSTGHRWFQIHDDPIRGRRLGVTLRGHALLGAPILSKGSAFTAEERERLGLSGLLPPAVCTLEDQVRRVRDNYLRAKDDLARYMDLEALHDRNETLFYRLLVDRVEELLPIVYTPTVGQACKEFGHIFRRGRGLFLTPADVSRLDEILGGWPADDVRVIVVTDGERILGLGDLGSGGMGIPIGKLALYVAAGGIHPSRTLPVTLDVGTNNAELVGDALYMGTRTPRLRGAAYDAFLEAFLQAVGRRFPRALVQFEDFGTANAFALLERYRDRCLSFNDDIQGTAAVVAAGIFAAMARQGGRLADQRFVLAGAGESAIGIASLLASAMAGEGLAEAEAGRRFGLVDSQGLVFHGRGPLSPWKTRFARPQRAPADLASVVREVRPTVLIGASAQAGLFTREIVETLAQGAERPILFALSNPTSKSECTPEQAFAWAGGPIAMATGSPFPPVSYGGSSWRIGQANNAFVFPGVGLGSIAVGARRITDDLFLAAARTLARLAPSDPREPLYPGQGEIRRVSREVAVAVGREAVRAGLADLRREEEVERRVDAEIWDPAYLPYDPA